MAEKAAQPAQTIRAQAKKSKGSQQAGGSKQVDRIVTKAVLANPLTVPWPNIPRHLQTTILANLPAFVPTDIAEYHTSRARCHTKEKRKLRSKERENAIRAAHAAQQLARHSGENLLEVEPSARGLAVQHGLQASGAGSAVNLTDRDNTAGSAVAETTMDADIPAGPISVTEPLTNRSRSTTAIQRKPHPPNTQTPTVRPERPEMLNHLVLGLNEVIKALERQTDDLRRKVIRIGEALAEQQYKGKRKRGADGTEGNGMTGKAGEKGRRVLLPTAPRRDDEEVEDEDMGEEEEEAPVPPVPISSTPAVDTAQTQDSPAQISPLEWLILPLLSLSPPTLASPLPAYCATFNTLIYQHTHLSKIARSRLPASVADDIIGEKWEEVRVVPLGRVEEDLAALVGLRRMACLGIRASHPQITTLRTLLPKSILHPPRHSLTLPFPISALTVPTPIHPLPLKPVSIAGMNETPKKDQPRPNKQARIAQAALVPHVHYAPLHVKGITTTIPADGNARKLKRLEEVRAKRREKKEKKRLGKGKTG